MTPRRLILLCNPASIRADGKPTGGRPSFTVADAAMAFSEASDDEFSAFSFRWGGWDSEYERCLLALRGVWADCAKQRWVAMPEDEETALYLCALVLREEHTPQTIKSRCVWMNVSKPTWYKRFRAPFIVLSQAFEMWCNEAERKAWKKLRQNA